MLCAALALLAIQPQQPFDFYGFGPYDPNIPKPESILGYGPGERHTTFAQQEEVIGRLAASAPDRIAVRRFGKSTEGRPLRIVAISSAKNMGRLDEIREANQRIANGEDPQGEVPAIIWINQCIHGDETASFESSMWLIYTLAASRSRFVENALENAVVIVNPSYNPDGHERFVVWFNSVAVGTPNRAAPEHSPPPAVQGRVNHYRFDLNRDRIAMSQVESVAEAAEYRRWNPHVYVDQHGEVSTYFFPPNPMAVNANIDRQRLHYWTEILGRATAHAFDQQGWTYFIRDTFDIYYAGYLDSWTALSGAIGMTHETDGGSNLVTTREDGTEVTLRDGMAKHFTSAISVVAESARQRSELVGSFARFKAKAADGSHAGKFARVVLSCSDPRPLLRLADQLDKQGIQYRWLQDPFEQLDAHDYWSDTVGKATFPRGSLVIDMAQPFGQLAKALLEPHSDFEPEFVKLMNQPELFDVREGGESGGFYDLTAWALPYAHSVHASWCESAPPVKTGPAPSVEKQTPSGGSVGWVIAYTDREDALGVMSLMRSGVRVRVATQTMRLDGNTVRPGEFIVLRGRNDSDAGRKIAAAAEKFGLRVRPLDSGFPSAGRAGPGSDATAPLQSPKIALAFSGGYGAVWHLLETTLKLPFTPVANVGALDLSEFNTILLPSTGGASEDALRAWVSDGGNLILLGSRGGGFIIQASSKTMSRGLPGSLFRAEIDDKSALSFGRAGRPFAVPVSGRSLFSAEGAHVKLSAADGKATVLSGWTWPDTQAEAAGGAWVVRSRVGQGTVTLFLADPCERALWPGLQDLLVNAILFGGVE